MALSSNIHAYADVATVLMQILPQGKGIYRLPTSGAARHWAQRANKYRRLLQEQERIRLASPKGINPPTPYDQMKVRVAGCEVQIDLNPVPEGEIILPSGAKIKPQVAVPASEPLTPPEDSGDLSSMAALLLQAHSDDEV